MRYRVSNIPLWLGEEDAVLVTRAAERLGLSPGHLSDVLVVRRSLDARRKGHARWLVNLEVTLDGGETGYWDAEQHNWVADESYADDIEEAIRVARQEGAPDLLRVPVPAPVGVGQ